jgi:uncharacterized protein (DUF983 family)
MDGLRQKERGMNEDSAHFAPVDPVKTGVKGCCPRCGEGRLFEGVLSLRPRCAACGLDYGFADAGDGPAVFVILIVGFIVIGMVLWLQVNYAPPIWVHILLFAPLTVALSLLSLALVQGHPHRLAVSQQCQPGINRS